MSREEKSHAKLIALRELKGAKALLGSGWDHVSDEIRWSLLCAGILSVIIGQHALSDEDATTEELARVATYAQELWIAARVLQDRNWRP
jgi:hypothetical protein